MAQDYTHLHVHTDASLLDGGNTVDKLLARAKDHGMKSMAVTDHGVLYNIWSFQEKAKKAGIRPILGMEAYVAPGRREDKTAMTPMDKYYYHLVLLAQNETGYKNLVKLSSRGFKEGYYYKPRVDREILEQHSEGIIVSSACLAGEVAQNIEAARQARGRGDETQAKAFEAAVIETIAWYKKTFPDRFFLEVQAHTSDGQKELNKEILRLADALDTPVVATTDAHFLNKSDHAAHDCLVAIGMHADMDDPQRLRYDEGLYFQNGNEVGTFFNGRSDVLDRTMEVADRVHVGFNKHYHVPSFPMAESQKDSLDNRVQAKGGIESVLSDKVRSDDFLSTDDLIQRAREVELLRELAEAGTVARYGENFSQEVRDRLEYELKVISDAGYAGYHLIVQDFIAKAREDGIPVGPGRGSAAGSLVCYALRITDVDPIKYDLLFERFLNPDRVSMPDIDVDFCEEGRGQVIDYVKDKYGHDAVCQIITFGTLQSRAVVKDVGRVMGFSPKEMDEFAKLIPNAPNYSLTVAEAIEKIPEVKRRYTSDERWRRLCDLSVKLEGLKRSAGVHASGILIAPGPVEEYVPVARSKEGGLLAQYDMNDLEKAGMLKMDFLGLSTLTVIADTLKGVVAIGQEAPDLDTISLEDQATYKMFADGHVTGVFQFESSLAKDKLTAMRPDRLEDLIATNALLRPGPLEAGMADAYIRRKRGEEEVTLPHPKLKDILVNTYGIITYQEQVMRAAQALAGYTLAEADMLRKAIGKKDDELLAAELGRFKERAVSLGICTPDQARDIAALIETFGRYGFNRSHSVAYSILGYRTAYLKRHHPEPYMAALLSSVMGDKDDLSRYLAEARSMGIQILAPSVNESGVKFTALARDGKPVVRFGLTAVKDVGPGMVQAILEARKSGPFADFFDFVQRAQDAGGRPKLSALIESGACDGLGPSRAAMLDAVAGLKKEQARIKRIKDKIKKDEEKTENDPNGDLFSATPKKRAGKPQALPEDGVARVAYADVPEMELGEMLEREKNAIGLYVSGNPMDPYKEQAQALASHQASELGEYRSGNIRVVGVVSSSKGAVSKKGGNMYGKITVEDLSGSIGAIAFNKEWERYGHLLKPGTLVILDGTFSASDKDMKKGSPELRVNKVQGLKDAILAGDLGVTIKLSPEVKQDAGAMERIRQVLAEHEGNGPVLIEESGPPQRIREAKSKVRADQDLVNRLREIVGPASVAIRPGVGLYEQKSAQAGGWRGRGRS